MPRTGAGALWCSFCKPKNYPNLPMQFLFSFVMLLVLGIRSVEPTEELHLKLQVCCFLQRRSEHAILSRRISEANGRGGVLTRQDWSFATMPRIYWRTAKNMTQHDKDDSQVPTWKPARLEGWKAGGLEGWRAGRLEGSRAGGLEGYQHSRTVREYPQARTLC